MSKIKCFTGIKVPGLEKSFNKQVNENMTEQEEKTLAIKVVLDYYKKIVDELNNLKKSIGVKTDTPSSFDFFPKIKEINDRYNSLIEKEKLRASNEIITKVMASDPQIFNNLTEDGKGNYVFFHYSGSNLKTIDPSRFGNNVNKTSKEERSRSVPVSMYYTTDDVAESGLGDFKHIVRIPMEQVYPFNADPLNLYDEAEKRFREQYPDRAFSPNEQIGWIGKVAAEGGYKMIVGKWEIGKKKTIRAESVEVLKPELVQRPRPGYASNVVETLTDEKFVSNKKRYKGKASQNAPAESIYTVEIDEAKLAELVEENKKTVKKPVEDNVIPNEEKYQKNSEQEFQADSEQLKRFVIGNIVRLLSTKFNIQFEYDNNMPQAAKFANGKVYLNMNKIGPDSAFHEIAHPFIEMIKSENSALYNNLINELKNSEEGKAEIERVAKEYPELSPQEQLDEALVSMIGKNASEEYFNSEETPKKSLLRQFWDWVKEKLGELGFINTDFKPTMTIRELSKKIADPFYSYDLGNKIDLANTEEYYQKASLSKFDKLVERIQDQLRADARGISKEMGKEEKTRRFFSGKQADALAANLRDLKALDRFIMSSLGTLKDVNIRFEEIKNIYESKKTKTQKDVQYFAKTLSELQDTVELYNNVDSLLSSILSEFKDDETQGHFEDLTKNYKRELAIKTDYEKYGKKVISEWLASLPNAKKAINKALAEDKPTSLVSKAIYEAVVAELKAQKITDKRIILERAFREELSELLGVADRDASWFSMWVGPLSQSRDAVSSLVGIAVNDVFVNASKRANHIKESLSKLIKAARGTVLFATNKASRNFYSSYLRQVVSHEFKGMNTKGEKEYHEVKRWGFHEEYKWDEFYKLKRDEVGIAPPSKEISAYEAWKKKKSNWDAANVIKSVDKNGKEQWRPVAKYKNAEFEMLQSDDLFKTLYSTYSGANEKLGLRKLKYGIIPQDRSHDISLTDVKNVAKNIKEKVRLFVGQDSKVYFDVKNDLEERKNVPIGYNELLEEDELSFNLGESVAKFVSSSEKYHGLSDIEPLVKVLKNFIGGNTSLNLEARKTIKRSVRGKVLSKFENSFFKEDAKRLNVQLNRFLDKNVYGEGEVENGFKILGAKFKIKNNKTGEELIIKDFDNVLSHTGLHIDFRGFEIGKERVIGDYAITMVNKDWTFSVNKTASGVRLLTAVVNLGLNLTSGIVNIVRGKSQNYIEAAGGKRFSWKNALQAEVLYFGQLIKGTLSDVQGGKPGFLNTMLIEYDAIQGEFLTKEGKKINGSIANKLFRRDNLFVISHGGEHYIQSHLMISMMLGQKVTLKDGSVISLYDAKQREYEGTLNFTNDTTWTQEDNDVFRNNLQFTNEENHGNYSEIDKAYVQKYWLGNLVMLFRRHIYPAFASRYRGAFNTGSYMNYKGNRDVRGYYVTFISSVIRQMQSLVENKKLSELTEDEKVAYRKIAFEFVNLCALIGLFGMFDDDDREDEGSDFAALIARRLMSEAIQYTPVLGTVDLLRIINQPIPASSTLDNLGKALYQTITDPDENYERSGPGYTEGDNKAWTYWKRGTFVGYRQFLNVQEPERLLDYYGKKSFWFFKPKSNRANDE